MKVSYFVTILVATFGISEARDGLRGQISNTQEEQTEFNLLINTLSEELDVLTNALSESVEEGDEEESYEDEYRNSKGWFSVRSRGWKWV